MVSPDGPAAPRWIAPEIAQRYGRALTTVQKVWMVKPAWPAPAGRRGHWNEYLAADVEAAIGPVPAATETPGAPGDPDELLTISQIAVYTGKARGTIAAYVSRGQYPDPDEDADGVKRWRRATVDADLTGRRGYLRRHHENS
ncbi:helix-turn-helix transcriptional regulator [Nocardia sp. CA-128927]|uniref:helix-turn-helix transcriptional regulator n=1 Tax=Nocardia sp. CA-128927 TaxID=3239975 RepID=UPI003D9573C1